MLALDVLELFTLLTFPSFHPPWVLLTRMQVSTCCRSTLVKALPVNNSAIVDCGDLNIYYERRVLSFLYVVLTPHRHSLRPPSSPFSPL